MALLVAAREQAGMTQAGLAARLGRRQSFVARYEGGERRLDLLELMAIARALQFDWICVVKKIEAEYGAPAAQRAPRTGIHSFKPRAVRCRAAAGPDAT